MIEVFYIAYLKKDSHWGLPAFKRFLASYEKYNAGIEHKLTILLRGYEDNLEDYNKIKEICVKKNISTLDTVDIGLDFGAYLDGAKQSEADYICCLNTSCEIMCDDWLKKLYSPIEQDEKYKMVGVCGSYEISPVSLLNMRSSKNFFEKVTVFFNKINPFCRLYKLFFISKIKNYPNPHIRTSAFLINKSLFINYFDLYELPQNKLEACSIESGRHSLLNFLESEGYYVCVADKFGEKFDKQDFEKSETYRCRENNYIIRDRMQGDYENSNFLIKMYLRRICWGKF